MALLSELIRHDEPLSVGATAVYPHKPALERKYRFTSRFGDEVLLYRVEGNVIHLPRALCPVGGKDERHPGKPAHFPKGPTPRPNQVAIFDETAAFLLKGLSGIVAAYTGWGKTYLGYHAAHAVQRKTLVVTTKDDIYKQWIAGAPAALGISPDDVGEIRGDKCEVKGTKFVVAMIHSLSRDGKYPEWLVDLMNEEFGLVIFDECHRLPADQFQEVATMFRALLRLGLSATVDRSDGKELLVYAHVGPVRAKTESELLVPKVLRFTTNWQCPRVLKVDKETGQKTVVRLPHEPGKTTHIEKMLAADPERTHQVADGIKTAFDKGRKIVVFSTLHDHLKSLHRAVVDLGVSGKQTGFYIGAKNKSELEARDKVVVRPVLFTTFSMMAEGTNIPWLDTCVLAMPRSNVTQPAGRIRREYEDKGDPVVMDYVDNDSPVFAGYATSRMNWYRKIGCVVKDMN